jgi:hypothetical protein
MDKDDQDTANAALLLTEKIEQRIAEAMANPNVVEALLANPRFNLYVQGVIETIVTGALQQLATRLQPTTYWTSTGTTITAATPKNYW